MSKRQTVHPVADRWIPGIPTASLIVDARTAARLVRTGAFTRDAPDGDEPEGGRPEPIELSDEQLAVLDGYDNVDDEPEAPEPEAVPAAPDIAPKPEAPPA